MIGEPPHPKKHLGTHAWALQNVVTFTWLSSEQHGACSNFPLNPTTKFCAMLVKAFCDVA
jgi:hypothetical protein